MSDCRKPKLVSLTASIKRGGFDLTLTDDSIDRIGAVGFRGDNLALANIATNILIREKPITLRGLFYRVVSAGWLPSTDKKHYGRLGRLMTRLRETGCVPFSWLVDNLRSSIKPSSWSGLEDFTDTVAEAYRKDFWSGLPEYVHIFAEKDAISGVLAPVTREYDVPLSPIRGYVSLSFAHSIATDWNRIQKPIKAYYLGDFDPSGFDLERDLVAKLHRYCQREFEWTRLAVNQEDLDNFNLIPLEPKKSDKRYHKFISEHGERCAELDALPATELRKRIREAIESYIPQGEWERLKEIEAQEKAIFRQTLGRFERGEY